MQTWTGPVYSNPGFRVLVPSM